MQPQRPSRADPAAAMVREKSAGKVRRAEMAWRAAEAEAARRGARRTGQDERIDRHHHRHCYCRRQTDRDHGHDRDCRQSGGGQKQLEQRWKQKVPAKRNGQWIAQSEL